MKVYAKFVGGPRGGEVETLTELKPRIDVLTTLPVQVPPRFVSESTAAHPAPLQLEYHREEYALDRRYRTNYDSWDATYVWVNPNAGLLREVKQLRAELSQLADLQAALLTFKGLLR